MHDGEIARHLLRRYRFVREIGAGGMGRVVLVQDLARDGRELALKWADAAQPICAEETRHLREFRILARFRHPHIMRVHNFYRVRPAVGQYFTAEYLGGPSLADLCARGPLDLELARTLLVQILRALEFVHENGWMHCDIKPGNVQLRDPLDAGDPHCCLIDFGISQPENHVPDKNVMGTVYYIAPERIVGSRVDRRSDLYAVGVLAYQMFTGQLPFPGEDKTTVLEAHLRRPPPRPSEVRPDLPEDIDDLVLALLAKKPGERPASARAVLQHCRQHWQQPRTLETPETVQAYLDYGECTGWEEDVCTVLGKVKQRVYGKRGDEWTWLSDELDKIVGDDAHLLPLAARLAGDSQSGMVIIKGGSSADLATFREYVRQRIEALGVYEVTVFGRDEEPVRELVEKVLLLLPDDRVQEAAEGYALLELMDGCGDDEPRIGVPEIAEWLGNVARDFPFAVLADGLESWGERFFALIAQVVRLEPRNPSLASIAWIGFQRDQTGLFAGLWLSSEEGRQWTQPCALRALDPESIHRWLSTHLPGARLNRSLRSLLEEESEGSPALLVRLLGSMVAEGVLTKNWHGWVFAEATAVGEHTPLVRHTMQLLDRLDPRLRQVLEALEVLGGRADPEWLGKLTGHERGEAFELMRELEEAGWLEREVGGHRCRFRHFYQRKSVRESLGEAAWKEGNLKVAEWLLEISAQGRNVDPGRLATHLLAAGDTQRAASHAEAAADRALDQGRALVAMRWLERILETDNEGGLERRAEWTDRLGDLRQSWGPPDETLRLRERALEELRGASNADPIAIARLVRKLAVCHGLDGNFEAAEQALLRQCQVLEPSQAGDELREVLILLAELHLYRGQAQHALRTLENLSVLPPAASALASAREYRVRAECGVANGQIARAVETLREAVQKLDHDVRDPESAAWIVYLLARRQHLEGSWTLALHLYRLAAFRFAAHWDHLMQGRSLFFMGELSAAMGLAHDATGYLEGAEILLRRVGARAELPRVTWSRGRLLCRRGFGKEGSELLRQALDWGKQYPRTPWHWLVRLMQAELSLRSGRLDDCRKRLEGNAHPSRAPHKEEPEPWVWWGELAVDLALCDGNPQKALAHVERTLLEVRERGGRQAQIPVWMTRWRVLQACGCSNPARRLRSQIDEWLRSYPEHRRRWSELVGSRPEVERVRDGYEDELARYYLGRARIVCRAADWDEGLFLLEEAKYHARRAGAATLAPVINARLAVARHRSLRGAVGMSSQGTDPEPVLRSSWKRLLDTGAVEGRMELLSVWAEHCADSDRKEHTESLVRAITRRLRRWSESIPVFHAVEALAEALGIEPGTYQNDEEPVQEPAL